jgi:hypothetical protein
MVAGAPFSNVSAASAALSMQLRIMQLLFTDGWVGVVFPRGSLLDQQMSTHC